MRKQKGITLIALVITIIVLLILAAVSITALTDEDKGVVTKAKQAAHKTEEAAEQEDDDIKEILDYANSEDWGAEEEETYKVTFYDYDGTTVLKIVSVDAGGTASCPTPTRSGYTFSKWITNLSNSSSNATLTNIQENMTVYAYYTYNSNAPSPYDGQ